MYVRIHFTGKYRGGEETLDLKFGVRERDRSEILIVILIQVGKE